MDTILADSIDEELWFGEDDPAHADRAASESLAASVARISGLKPLPIVVQKVLTELGRADWSSVRVATLMESDPSLASMVLRLANSSFYSRGQPVRNVHQAIGRLGGSKLKELVVGAAAMQMVRGRGRLATAWRDHCAGTAAVVRELCALRPDTDQSIAFLAGLLHDMGKLLLLDTGEIQYDQLPEAAHANDEGLAAAERALCAFDHAVLGGHVIKAWGPPEPLPQLVAWHHQPIRAYDEDGDLPALVCLLRLGDRLAEHLDANTDPDFAAIARTSDATWLGADAADLEALWPRLAGARAEAVAVFAG